MTKLKVELEINCDGNKCGDCKYLLSRFMDHGQRFGGFGLYCTLFRLFCDSSGDIPRRIDKCLNAEAHPLAETIAAIGAAGNKKGEEK